MEDAETRLSDYTDFKTPISVTEPPYSATGDGTTDDRAAIQAAIDAAATAGGSVVWFPEGTYLIKASLHVRGDVTLAATPGQATIKIDATYVPGGSPPDSVGVISNYNYATSYNDATADWIEFRGLRFQHTNGEATGQATMWFGNVKHLVVDSCDFIADGTVATTGIDVYASCKHVWITNNQMKISTGEVSGVGVQIRNFCGAAGATSSTEDIHIVGNYLESDQADEIIAAFAEDGPLRDVTIEGNTIKHVTGGSTPASLLSVFGDSAATPTAFTLVENVGISNNRLETDNFTNAVIQLGFPADATEIHNVTVSGNTIIASVSATGSTAGIRDLTNDVAPVAVTGNTIIQDGATAIYEGIADILGPVTGNMVQGEFSIGIASSQMATGNRVALGDSGIAIYNCKTTVGNYLTGVGNGIQIDESGAHVVNGNWVVLSSSGAGIAVYLQDVAGSNPGGSVVGNIFTTTAGGQYCITQTGTTAPRIGLNTWINGGGTYSSLATANVWTVADQ